VIEVIEVIYLKDLMLRIKSHPTITIIPPFKNERTKQNEGFPKENPSFLFYLKLSIHLR